MNKKMSIDQKIQNSRFDFIKKSLYFVIAPILILIVGVILLTTVGFSKGIDFAGGQTFKVYVNDEAKLADANVYDLDDKKDYNEVYNKICIVLDENNVDLVSYQTTSVNLEQYNVYSGQAVQVTFKANSKDFDESQLRTELIDAFGYDSFDGAISSIDEVPAVASFDWAIALLSAVLFAVVASVVYMAIRFSTSAIFVVFVQSALDVFLTLGLILICRVPINLTVGVTILSALMLSLINSFVYYNKAREIRKAGLAVGVKNTDLANTITKQILFKKALFYTCAGLATLLFVVLSTSAVREVALGVMIALISAFYTSTFVLPSLWALVDKPRKEKKKD